MRNKIFLVFFLFYIIFISRLTGCEAAGEEVCLRDMTFNSAFVCKEIYDINGHNTNEESKIDLKIDIMENFPYNSPVPPPPALPEGGRIIKLGLYQNLKSCYVGCDSGFSFYKEDGEMSLDGNQVLSVKIPDVPLDPNNVFIEPLKIKPQQRDNVMKLIIENADGTYTQKGYRGNFQVFLNSKGFITVVNELSLNEYLAGVVPNEMPSSFPQEALKSQAIVARTYTLKHLKKHEKDGFDLCATQHCQVYGGIDNETPETDSAVRETIHQMVFYGSDLADTVYSSTCGGITANVENVWQASPIDYLKSVPAQINHVYSTFSSEETFRQFIDNPGECFCQESKMFRWEKSYSKTDLQDIVSQGLAVILNTQIKLGDLIDVSVKERTSDGRVKTLLIKGSEGEYRVEKDKIRWLMSKGKINKDALPSTLFYIYKNENTISFKGGGWGHGIGLCQFCAKGMADRGMTSTEIITYFYPGCVLEYPLWYKNSDQ
jgi:SpoIID/LytB domain protein